MIEVNLLSMMPISIDASIKAGREILRIYESEDFEVKIKSDKSPLTDADSAANKLIEKALKPTGIPILSEEGRDIAYEERKEWEFFWLVDPLDGTKEFIKRNGEFTVNIALIHRGEPVLGAIYVPVSDVLYYGDIEQGAFKIEKASEAEGEMIKLPLQTKRNAFTVVGSRSHASEDTEKFVNRLKLQHGDLEFLSRGSSLKLCMIAEGVADVYPRFAPTMEWDTGAGQAIVMAAGGKVIRHDSKERLTYNKKNLLNPWFIAYPAED